MYQFKNERDAQLTKMNFAAYKDNGAVIKRLRITAHGAFSNQKKFIFSGKIDHAVNLID